MTGPSPNEPQQINEEEATNFAYWVTMLPFLVAIGVFVYLWTGHKDQTHWLMYAIGSLVIGLVVTALVGGAAGGNQGGTTSGDSKP